MYCRSGGCHRRAGRRTSGSTSMRLDKGDQSPHLQRPTQRSQATSDSPYTLPRPAVTISRPVPRHQNALRRALTLHRHIPGNHCANWTDMPRLQPLRRRTSVTLSIEQLASQYRAIRCNHIARVKGEFFHDDNLAVPFADRLIHHSHLFLMGGESYRLIQKQQG